MDERDDARGLGKEDGVGGYSWRGKRRRLKRGALAAVLAVALVVALFLRGDSFDTNRNNDDTLDGASSSSRSGGGGGVRAARGADGGGVSMITSGVAAGAKGGGGGSHFGGAGINGGGKNKKASSSSSSSSSSSFGVSQPKECAKIGSEGSNGASFPVVKAFVDMRTNMRVGKILRGCSKTGKEPEVRGVLSCH